MFLEVSNPQGCSAGECNYHTVEFSVLNNFKWHVNTEDAMIYGCVGLYIIIMVGHEFGFIHT